MLTLLVALAPALSAIGVCERCHVESGGVYFLLAHVLGQRSGGTIGILYSFGMVCLRFLDSFKNTFTLQCTCILKLFYVSLLQCFCGKKIENPGLVKDLFFTSNSSRNKH